LANNGTFQINSGGSISAAPNYGTSSTLIYNGVTNYNVSSEWTGNSSTSGLGIPKNVTLTSSYAGKHCKRISR
jgi:hypothetical protein